MIEANQGDMRARVRNTIEEFGMLEGASAVGVAVSGGADSICLLHLLHELAPEYRIALHVVHLNHGLRGPESEADERFVGAVAVALGLRCTVERVDLSDRKENLEQAAREARLAFFDRMKHVYGLGRIATGHTRSDQAETVLYRLLRGSGTAGLSGIQPLTTDGRIRPLLKCSRADVERYLSERGLSWREDSTNTDTAFARNRIRHELLPLLVREYSPAINEILAATAGIARDEEKYWYSQIHKILASLTRKRLFGRVLRADELGRLHPAVARRVLRQVIAEVKGNMRSIDLLHIERVLDLARQKDGHGRLQIPGLDIFRSFEWLQISLPKTEPRSAGDYCFRIELQQPGESAKFSIPGGCPPMFLEIRDLSISGTQSAYNEGVYELDWGRLNGQLELRNWYPGDQMELPGRSPQKIKQLFQEFRIPIWDRHQWPVLTCGDQVVWARQFGVSTQFQRDNSTRYVLRVYESEDARDSQLV